MCGRVKAPLAGLVCYANAPLTFLCAAAVQRTIFLRALPRHVAAREVA